MIYRKNTFFLGILIFLIPFLGLPTSWKTTLTIISGILLILLSIKVTLPKKGTRVKSRKEKVTPVFAESSPILSGNTPDQGMNSNNQNSQ